MLRELRTRGIRTRKSAVITKGFLYRLLNNRAYVGEAMHKGESYPGEHAAIFERDTWDRRLADQGGEASVRTTCQDCAAFFGLVLPQCFQMALT